MLGVRYCPFRAGFLNYSVRERRREKGVRRCGVRGAMRLTREAAIRSDLAETVMAIGRRCSLLPRPQHPARRKDPEVRQGGGLPLG